MGSFMGKDGFIWFVGVVEDRMDPNHLGRLRVRALGYHTEDMIKLPTADLPWSHVLNPITSATVSGVGQSPLGAVEGTWVMGYFRDGDAAQEAVIMGTLPGVPGNLPTKVAKNEDDDNYPGKGFQDYKNANYPKYKETDVNRLAVGDADNPHSTLTLRKADIDEGVGQALIDDRANIASLAQVDDSERVHQDYPAEWSEPTTPYAAVYPYNHVYESEGGHISEMDDTPGKERIHERHASGSGYEIHPDGTKVTRVKKDNYSITTGDDYVHLQGDSTTTIDGGLRVFINKDKKASGNTGNDKEGNNYNIQVGEGANVTIQVDKGDINLIAPSDEGNINMKCGGTLAIEADDGIHIKSALFKAEIQDTWTEEVGGDNFKTGAAATWTAKTIDLNGPDGIDLN